MTSPPSLSDVAVLLPAFNCQAALLSTLQSLREPAPVRVLIVDDGSLPPLVAPHIAGLEIDILRLPVNGGIERALAQGAARLLQDGLRYIARIDAGDLAHPNRLVRQRAYLDTHPGVGVLGSWVELVGSDGRHVATLRPPAAPADIRRQRFLRTCLAHPAVMLRAEAVQRAGGYRTDFRAAEDLDLFLRIMEEYGCANLADVCVTCVLNEGGISATRRRAQIRSTLRLQCRYFTWTNPLDWLGFAKTLLHSVISYRLLQRIKRAVLRP